MEAFFECITAAALNGKHTRLLGISSQEVYHSWKYVKYTVDDTYLLSLLRAPRIVIATFRSIISHIHSRLSITGR